MIPVCGTHLLDGTRMPCPYCVVDWTSADSRRRKRPAKTWQATFCEDIQARGVNWSEMEVIAADHLC